MGNERNLIQQIQDYSKDIVVMAPSEGKEAFRIYANGGLICELTYNPDNSISVSKKTQQGLQGTHR